jgi:hypothetical protein
MKIKCIYNHWDQLPEIVPSINLTNRRNSQFYVEVDQEYIVYGMTIREGFIWYYLCDQAFTYFPRWKPSPFFEVIDPRISRYWIYSYKKMDSYLHAHPILTFPEWANNHPDYYDKLTDGRPYEVEVFHTYKEWMDLEFPDKSIFEYAEVGDKEWLICSQCIDPWQDSNPHNGMVRCPKCNKIMHNPRYQDACPAPLKTIN